MTAKTASGEFKSRLLRFKTLQSQIAGFCFVGRSGSLAWIYTRIRISATEQAGIFTARISSRNVKSLKGSAFSGARSKSLYASGFPSRILPAASAAGIPGTISTSSARR